MEKIEFVVQMLPMAAMILCMVMRGIDVFNISSALVLASIILFNLSYLISH